MVPQYWFPSAVAQVAGMQIGGAALHTFLSQVHPVGQLSPHSSVPPHPSPTVPQ
jgi:hypothetical protein